MMTILELHRERESENGILLNDLMMVKTGSDRAKLSDKHGHLFGRRRWWRWRLIFRRRRWWRRCHARRHWLTWPGWIACSGTWNTGPHGHAVVVVHLLAVHHCRVGHALRGGRLELVGRTVVEGVRVLGLLLLLVASLARYSASTGSWNVSEVNNLATVDDFFHNSCRIEHETTSAGRWRRGRVVVRVGARRLR